MLKRIFLCCAGFSALLFSLLTTQSCKDDDVKVPVVPTVHTAEVVDITRTSATTGGEVVEDGGREVTARGVCWSTSPNPTISNFFTEDGEGDGVFTSELVDLEIDTKYYVRAYAKNSVGIGYGEAVSFTTGPAVVPTVHTAEVVEITQTSAKTGGEVVEDGGRQVTARGVCWSTSPNPTINDFFIEDAGGEGEGENDAVFTSRLSDLNASTTYHVRAYATNSVGTGYGEAVSFTTLSAVVPEVVTDQVSSIAKTTAMGGSSISFDGGAPVTSRGLCYSLEPEPTLDDMVVTVDVAVNPVELTGLQASTTYYVRAFATNSVGTGYGPEVSFTTAAYDVYIAGHIFVNNVDYWPFYLKNHKLNVFPMGSATSGSCEDIAVNGMDIHAVGYLRKGDHDVAAYWKNNQLTELGPAGVYSKATAVAVFDGDVFVVGHIDYRATYWRNGIAYSLSDASSAALDITIVGGKKYIAGYEYEDDGKAFALYWTLDGATTKLSDGTNNANANTIVVNENDVYVAGVEYSTQAVGKYWKNGSVTNITATNPRIESMALVENKLHLVGVDYAASGTKAGYWIDGVPLTLPAASNAYLYDIDVYNDEVYIVGGTEESQASMLIVWKNQAVLMQHPGMAARAVVLY